MSQHSTTVASFSISLQFAIFSPYFKTHHSNMYKLQLIDLIAVQIPCVFVPSLLSVSIQGFFQFVSGMNRAANRLDHVGVSGTLV